MKKRTKLILIGIFLLLFISLVSLYFFKQNNNKKNILPKEACFQDYCFLLEIANTPAKRAQGLMYRKELATDKAMLFIFPKQGIYSFWMKNTLIPLDIIWINKEQKVVFIKRNALPCQTKICPSISPDKEAKYVLEIKAGLAEEIGLKIGDSFSFNF